VAAFDWSTDLWAPAGIAVLGVLIAVFFARRASIRATADQRQLSFELLRTERELDAIDRFDETIRRLRDAIEKWMTSLNAETVRAATGAKEVEEAFFQFVETADLIQVRLRPELREVVARLGQSAFELGGLMSDAEMLDALREEDPAQDHLIHAELLESIRKGASELRLVAYNIRDELMAAVDLYVQHPPSSRTSDSDGSD
jgi:hypothetical protein